MRKFGPEDQLNCGSCGYPSCREKAIAVCQGIAEVSMCLPYLVEELEMTLSVLQRSHQATQDRLVQTERLASMGQISAGVAHEINNPLSTILLYSHMLLKAHREGDAESEDIQMIVNEANRCRSIMRGLLDFARQSRVVKTPTDLGLIAHDMADAMNMKLADSGTRVRAEVQEGMPRVMRGRRAGPPDAREPRAERHRRDRTGRRAARWWSASASRSPVTCAVLRVRDTGSGMPQEMLKDIFTPFYTTKQLGKGTAWGCPSCTGW